MVRPEIGKSRIFRRHLLYAFYGLVSFTTIVSCGTNRQWANKNRRAAAQILAPKVKTDVDTIELALTRRKYDIKPITEKVISQQQKVADLLYQLKIVPKPVNIREAVLTSQQYAAITPDAVMNKT